VTALDYAASGAALGAIAFALTQLVKLIRDAKRTDPARARRLAVEYRPRQGTLERRSVPR